MSRSMPRRVWAVPRARRLAATGLLAALALTACDPPPTGWTAELVTASADGQDAANDLVALPVISPDGTRVAFESKASNLGPDDDNGTWDVYVRDLTTGVTSLVSTSATGSGAGNRASQDAAFSPDGTMLAFTSYATDLDPRDTDDEYDLYLADMNTGAVSLLTPGPDDCGGGPADTRYPRFSPDGTSIAFQRKWPDGVATVGSQEVYVHDLATRVDTRVSAHTGGGCSDSPSSAVEFSPDGRWLGFVSEASDLGPDDTNGLSDSYLYELSSGSVTRLSSNIETWGIVDTAGSLVFAPDGQTVAFMSSGADHGVADTNGSYDVYLRDLTSGATRVISVSVDGTPAGGVSGPLAFSPDSSAVAFGSGASTFGPTDTNGALDVYVHDLVTGVNTLVSVNAAGTNGSNGFISGGAPKFLDDHSVVFGSFGTDLGFEDSGTDGADIFLRDLETGVTTHLSAGTDATDGVDGPNMPPTVSASGRIVVFASDASNLGPNDTNGLRDLYVVRYHDHADLQLGVEVSADTVSPGDRLTYHATVTNDGPDDAPSARLALLLPEGVRLITGSSSQGNCDSPDGGRPLVVCGFGQLAPGAEAEASITVEVTGGTSTLQMFGIVLSDVPDAVGDNGSLTIETPVSP